MKGFETELEAQTYIDNGGDIEAKTFKFGYSNDITALSTASIEGNVSVVRFLLFYN